ncbi:hypothetical protein OB955_07095 [Halobacteria archaeon AArc-m2/3/4]|uniref:Uncharacterized protein n=1 Tax=Natronoglomus mannanivorans TaxID=2979990 RepID=A0AAP2YWX3_9EURY|nr:hypothetical protein [Halobacteria archaeon AArc-xg1-1]MCU4972502.1 hypothetical protein [Halobacteria archaeon AArc-m2/3/4]
MGSSGSDESIESFGAEVGQRTGPVTRLREWFLLEGDRLFVATLVSVVVFLLFLTLDWLDVIAFLNDDSMTRLAGGMIAGTFSLVTLVVSINQLILSREFTAAGETRDRLDGVREFRGDIAEAADVPASPASPTQLLDLLVTAINHRAGTLAEAVSDHDDEVREQVTKYTNGVEESTERVEESLSEANFGTFQAVSAAIGYNDSWQLYVATHLQSQYDDSLSADADEAFDDLIDTLELFNVAREHFKTTYLQRELTRFSQLTIYCGVPAILSAMLVGLLYADLGGPAISTEYLPIVASALIAVIVSPLSLLVAYILRTATITHRTASIGPMLPQKDPDEGPFDVSYVDED